MSGNCCLTKFHPSASDASQHFCFRCCHAFSYKSFSRDTDNIGDITAKGEAQIAVIDLLGLLMGVLMSRVTHLSRAKVATMFLLLSAADIYCVRREIQRLERRSWFSAVGCRWLC